MAAYPNQLSCCFVRRSHAGKGRACCGNDLDRLIALGMLLLREMISSILRGSVLLGVPVDQLQPVGLARLKINLDRLRRGEVRKAPQPWGHDLPVTAGPT